MDHDNTIRRMRPWVLISGIMTVVFYVLHDVIGSMNYSGYDWKTQAVSDLTAVDAPSRIVAGGLTTCYGICSCLCCAFLTVMVKDVRKSLRLGIYLFAAMNGISAIGYALFPLTGSGYDGSVPSFIHLYIVTSMVVLLSIASLIVTAVGSFRDHRKLLGVLAILALAAMFFGAVGSIVLPKEIFGIVERFSTYSAVIFTGILGVYGCLKLSKASGSAGA